MENKEKAKKITKGPKVEQNKNLIIGWSIILILILFIIIYLILNKSGNKDLIHKPSLSANVSSVDFSSCSKDSEESCEYTETRDGKTIKVNYFINNGEDIESTFITINDEIVLINDFYKLNDKIYFLDDIIILSVEDLEQTNTIMYMLDLDGKELKKIEHIDETASGMRISGFTVKGKEIIIDATNLVDEFHYLRLDNDGEEHLYDPETIYLLQKACREKDYKVYKSFAKQINKKQVTIRSLFDIGANRNPIPDRKSVV